MADGATHDFGVTISPAENMIDVSSDDGMQIASGRNRSAGRVLTPGTTISLLITTNEIVHLSRPGATLTERAGPLDISDLVIDAYGPKGRALGIIKLLDDSDPPVPILATEEGVIGETGEPIAVISHRDPLNPGKEFLAEINAVALQNAYVGDRAGADPFFEIHTLLISIPKAALNQADVAHVTAMRNDAHAQHTSAAVAVYRVDLVDDDQGNPAYNIGVSAIPAAASGLTIGVTGDGTAVANRGSGTPGVVAIQTLRERAGFIETGPFDVRIILTEEPTGGLTTDLIDVVNGSATAVTKGQPLKGAYAAVTTDPPGRGVQASELMTDMVDYYPMDLAEPPVPVNTVC